MSRDTLREALSLIAEHGEEWSGSRAAAEARAALEAEPVGLDVEPEPIANETESGYARRRELVAEARAARLTETP
jgi:hypothetical protein